MSDSKNDFNIDDLVARALGDIEQQAEDIKQKNDDVDHDIAMQRLAIMKSTNDGFKIAAEDLKLRGPGEVLGQKQKGFDLFRVVDVNRDIDLIEPARNVALDLIKNDIETSKALVKRWFPNFVVH